MRASILSWRKCTSISWTSMRCAKTKRPREKRWTRLLMRPSAPSSSTTNPPMPTAFWLISTAEKFHWVTPCLQDRSSARKSKRKMQDKPMETVKVSPKFQVVIPKRVREELQLRPGQELIVYILDGTIRFSKPRSIKELRGIAKGMKWKDDYRDRNDRF